MLVAGAGWLVRSFDNLRSNQSWINSPNEPLPVRTQQWGRASRMVTRVMNAAFDDGLLERVARASPGVVGCRLDLQACRCAPDSGERLYQSTFRRSAIRMSRGRANTRRRMAWAPIDLRGDGHEGGCGAGFQRRRSPGLALVRHRAPELRPAFYVGQRPADSGLYGGLSEHQSQTSGASSVWSTTCSNDGSASRPNRPTT